MKRDITSILITSLVGLFAALALTGCGGDPSQADETHAVARTQVTQALQSRPEGDAERKEFCQPPAEDPWGLCSQLCCFRVWPWGMDVCYYAPTPGACTATP